MPNTRSGRYSIYLACLAALFPVLLAAQEAPVKSSVTMADPARFLVTAIKSNGLTGEDVKPWRVVASFQEFNESGAVVNRGTYEETWAGAAKFKRSFSGDAFSIVEYGTEKGIVRTGGENRDDWQLTAIHLALADPLPKPSELESVDFETHVTRVGDLQLDCIALKKKATASTAPLLPTSSYCFGKDAPFLRLRVLLSEGITTVAENPNSFQNHVVAGDITVYRAEKLALQVRLEGFGELSGANDASFTPPADATPRDEPNHQAPLSPEEAAKNLIKQVPPEYPPIARAARIQGTVVLQVLIDKHGNVSQVGVVSGHPMLQQAALEAVRQWVYKPYKIDGKAVPIYTTVNVTFALEK